MPPSLSDMGFILDFVCLDDLCLDEVWQGPGTQPTYVPKLPASADPARSAMDPIPFVMEPRKPVPFNRQIADPRMPVAWVACAHTFAGIYGNTAGDIHTEKPSQKEKMKLAAHLRNTHCFCALCKVLPVLQGGQRLVNERQNVPRQAQEGPTTERLGCQRFHYSSL
eukprot:1158320-Pelagomonas_calceolata.AAC.5